MENLKKRPPSNRQTASKGITAPAQQPRPRLRTHRVQQRLPRLVAVRPPHVRGAGTPRAAAAGLVQLGVEGLGAVGDGFEDCGYVGVAEVEV